MPAILAKKLGMTQRFLEDGRVERVTVLEAGPCPVTAIRTHEIDGYEAVQLGVRRRAREGAHEAAARPPQEGRTRRPRDTLVEFRDEAGELTVGDTVTVEAFEVGQIVKVAGKGKGKGFAGHDQAPQLRRRSEVARLAQRARPGLDRRLGDAVARVQGHPRPGPDGRQARRPRRA